MAGKAVVGSSYEASMSSMLQVSSHSNFDSMEQIDLASQAAVAPREQRSRGMSRSGLWRRPKSAMLALDGLQGAPQQMDELAIDDGLQPLGGGLSPYSRSAPSRSGFRGLIRRASISFKGIMHRRPSVSTDDHDSEPRNHGGRPMTAHGMWNRLRHNGTSRSRSFYGLDFTQEPFSIPERSTHTSYGPRPGAGEQPPVIPSNTGAAAKASAAVQNEYLARQGRQNRWLQTTSSDDGNDRESGIGIAINIPGIEIETADGDLSPVIDADISKIDFVTKLPTELAIHVLAYLDAAALCKASAVCKRWEKIVSNQHIWRESCLRETTSSYATSGPIKPGTGKGIPKVLPSNDWRRIYRAKQELERRWKAGKARPIYLKGHEDSIYCLQFDEFKIVTGSRDRTIRVWDMHTLECRLIIGPPEIVSNRAAFRETRSHGDDGSGRSVEQPAESIPIPLCFAEHHKASILCLQYDDKILVTGSSDSTCIVYDIKAGYQPIRRLRHHTAAVLDLAFDEKHIVTSSKDNNICVWDRETGALLRQLRGHSGPVNAVQMRGNTIVSCSGDSKVKLWNIDTGKNIREFVGHSKGLACSQFSEDGRYVASAGNDKVIRIWDANTGESVREMRAHKDLVRSLHIDSVAGRLVSGSYDTDIKVWDMETGHQLLDFPQWHSSWVLSAKSDYRRIVSTGQGPKILIMDFGADVEGIEMLESRETNVSKDGFF